MAKRGAKAQGEYTGRSKVFSSRITPETLEKVTQAAKLSGRSVSQEFETRIVRSFREDEAIDRMFGSKRVFALMKMLAAAADSCWRPDRDDVSWLDDPWLFDQASDAINLILAVYSPVRDGSHSHMEPPTDFDYPVGGTEGLKIVSQVYDADPALPLNIGTRLDHRLASIKSYLEGLDQRAAIDRRSPSNGLSGYASRVKQGELEAKANFKAKSAPIRKQKGKGL
jgi:hypothetical protein